MIIFGGARSFLKNERPALINVSAMFFVYILQSLKDFRTYTGFTSNVEERLHQHNTGQVKATQYRGPFKILFTEQFTTSAGAKKRESYWKSGAGRRKLKEFFSK